MLYLIELQNVPIFEQLQIEEALLRTDTRNFCLINHGSSKAIVMGISGNIESLLNLPLVKQDKIPVIRRFSGGGTVIVDEETLFISFIFSKSRIDFAPFPEPILRWSADLYADAWQIPDFSLLENDYIIGKRKCGGNAQYIQKDRFLHHTSFLWNYKNENMCYLQIPAKKPQYRLNRGHQDFLCTINQYGSISELVDQLKTSLKRQFTICPFDLKEYLQIPHRKTVIYEEI